jgi:hypothetical protein
MPAAVAARKLYKILLATTVLILIGWTLYHPLILLALPNRNLTAMQTLFGTAISISKLGMFVDPIVQFWLI